MDTATTASEGNPEESEVGRSPSIGVPRIPAQAPPLRTPVPVPSVPMPSDPAGDGSEEDVDGPEPMAPSRPNPTPPIGAAATVTARPTTPASTYRAGGAHPAGTGAGLEARPGGSVIGGGPFDMAFPPGVAARLGWYVYLLSEPQSGRVLFVGRGREDRCFDHVRAARTPAGPDPSNRRAGPGPGGGAPPPSSDGTTGPFPGLDRIRQVEATDGPVRVEILRYGMSADEAKLAEVVAADALGLPVDTKRRRQRQAAGELGIRLAKRAKFKREHPVVLLRIGAEGADTGYENVRHGWRIGRRWTDPDAARSPRWAVIVDGEMVIGVYRIEGWEPTPLPGRPGPAGPSGTTRSTYRHSFVGRRDHQLEARYLGRSVASYLGAGPRPGAPARSGVGASTGTGVPPAIGAPNQVAYVGCGPHGTDRPG